MNINDYNCYFVDGKIYSSIDIMDKFTNKEKNYDFLILKEWFRIKREDCRGDYYIDLCVSSKRGETKRCINDITMTSLREIRHTKVMRMSENLEEPRNIKESITYTLAKYDIDNIDSNEMIQLDYYANLRAQTSLNRTGYGWEWEWHGYDYDYKEGTYYGETTDFHITHIMINRIKSYEEIKNEKIIEWQSEITLINAKIKEIIEKAKLLNKEIVHSRLGRGRIVDYDDNYISVELYSQNKVATLSLFMCLEKKSIAFLSEIDNDYMQEILVLKQKELDLEKQIRLKKIM